MNMQKQKPIWSKILAMLCALALCISMVPAASAARPSTTSTVSKVTVDAEGISEFWTETGETAIDSTGETIGNIRYSFSNSSLVIETTNDAKLPKTITFFAVVNYQPTITSSNDGVSAIASDYGDNWWMITISLANTTDDEVILNAEAVPTYTVTVNETPEAVGYTLIKGSSDTVKQGESYQFYVIPKTGYQAPNVTVTRGESAPAPISPSKDGTGLYTVSDIQSNITITIGEAQFQQYTVNFVSGDGYSFEGENNTTISNDKATVNYGGSVSFKVKLNDDYDNSNVIVYANGSKLEANAGVYTIENIMVNQTVSVAGVEKNKYTVTLPENTDGYYITTVDPTVVESGGQFTFNVVVNPGYESNNISVTTNNTTTVEKNEDGSYTISDITTDTTISISGIEAAQYNVTTNGGDHATIAIQGMTEDNKVGYGTQTFTVTPDAGYKVDSVKVNGTSVTADSHGTYTIFVSSAVNIVVTTSPVVEITLTTTVTGAGTTVVTVKTSNDWTSGNVEGVKIVGYGTLYSNQTFDPSALKDDIAGRSRSGESYTANGATVYNYYYDNAGIDLSALTGYTFSYKFNSSNSVSADSRYGAGWIELQQGDTKWIITTANAVALS